MSIILENANGFRLDSIERRKDKSFKLKWLIDGEEISHDNGIEITMQEAQEIRMKAIASIMKGFNIESKKTDKEREKIAKELMKLNIMNDYEIKRHKTEVEGVYDVIIDLLKTGSFFASIKIREVTEDDIEEIKDKLNKVKIHNLNAHKNGNPIHACEILNLLKTNR